MTGHAMTFPRLKGRFGFRLSVPSFIYPAGYVENVERLGGYVDEIELLLLQSDPEALPAPAVMARLAQLAKALSITYNVHLPIDTDPAALEKSRRLASVERLGAAIELAAPLDPTTYTLHLPFKEEYRHQELAEWQSNAVHSIDRLTARSKIAPHALSIETLDYPPEWLAPILAARPCGVCLDVGHVLNAGLDLRSALEALAPRISIVHLHAATGGTDHLALDRLSPEAWAALQPFLAAFAGSVSLEVFSAERLHASMTWLRQHTAVDLRFARPSGPDEKTV